MGCEVQKLPNGVTAIVCSRGRRQRCESPNCGNWSTALCDYPIKASTCDRRMCEKHRTSVGKDKDYCPAHARLQVAK